MKLMIQNLKKISAVVLVTFAITGGTPTINNAGYDTNEASPATDCINPAKKPAIIKNKMTQSILQNAFSLNNGVNKIYKYYLPITN